MLDLEQHLNATRCRINDALDLNLPEENCRSSLLHRAMRYSVFSGGKRLRPILCLAAAEAIQPGCEAALLPAIAIELLHTASLIHDDLPALDNEAVRRGKPATHVVFGVANALLAGDALVIKAFEWLARCKSPNPDLPNQFAIELAEAAGCQGMTAGQVEDLASETKPTSESLHFIHIHKSAALIRACTRIGAIAAGASARDLNALTNYGIDLGLAFQIVDDILDARSDQQPLVNSAPIGPRHRKFTCVSLHGEIGAFARAKEFSDRAQGELSGLKGPTELLSALAQFALNRKC